MQSRVNETSLTEAGFEELNLKDFYRSKEQYFLHQLIKSEKDFIAHEK